VGDEGLRKLFLVDSETASLIDLLGELGSGHDLRDVEIEEPGIEEVIRTFYQRRPGRPQVPA
jgi:ABC-2 type transport system ATP-binding protein